MGMDLTDRVQATARVVQVRARLDRGGQIQPAGAPPGLLQGRNSGNRRLKSASAGPRPAGS
jgi:hypothetical protein